jgi:hypothetical protein
MQIGWTCQQVKWLFWSKYELRPYQTVCQVDFAGFQAAICANAGC